MKNVTETVKKIRLGKIVSIKNRELFQDDIDKGVIGEVSYQITITIDNERFGLYFQIVFS